MKKSYTQTLEFLFSRLPMFTRDGASAFKNNLTNTIEFCQSLDNPQQKFKSIHIAGTNGKGSTSHILAAILQTAGYKTGLYTSPHLKDFRERIRINGEMISKNEVIDFVENNLNLIEKINPSFFEVTVAMAFEHFAKHKVDLAIIEVGLGGRLDSTNIITPILSVITNISYDHMNILGNTLQEIATEKAGIIKPRIPIIIGERQSEIEDVFIKKAEDTSSEITFASDEWTLEKSESPKVGKSGSLEGGKNTNFALMEVSITSHPSTFNTQPSILSLDLTGTYQLKNLKTVLSSVLALEKLGLKITDKAIEAGLRQTKKLTGLQGRWQILQQNPLIICDTGHNESGIKEVIKNINNTYFKHLHIVFGMLNDKDSSKILCLLPKNAIYYFCRPDLPRAKQASVLTKEAKKFNLKGLAFGSVKEALLAAQKSATKDDLIFVGGSTFVVAEVL